MESNNNLRVVCLSNIYDEHYHQMRGEKVERCLTAPFRRDLFRCLELATGRELIVLSSPPKSAERKTGKWLPPMETSFSTHRQFYCHNWDAPKWRIPLSWLFYARHVLRHVRNGDVVVIDNYEFIYIVAAWLLRLFRRRVRFVLVYLDGKHLIDRSWSRLLSGLAETMGRPLLSGALLSNPTLGRRLSQELPTELVPGFIPSALPRGQDRASGLVRFLYSGLLGRSHGTDILLEAIALLPDKGWSLVIAGQGPMEQVVREAVNNPQWSDRVKFLPPMSAGEFQSLLASSDVGLNCQRLSDPRSNVTFPSKIFTYLSTGLLVLSSQSGCVEPVCRDACIYYDGENPQSLASAMRAIIEDLPGAWRKINTSSVMDNYMMPPATLRLRKLLIKVGAINDK